MKFKLLLPILAAALLCGCATTPNQLTKSAVTAAVAAGVGFGLEQYPQAAPEVRIGQVVICASANSTNIEPQQIVDALAGAGINSPQAKTIINTAIAVYDGIFASYGNTWVNNKPVLKGYLGAVCDGLTATQPGAAPGPVLAARRNELPPHLR